MTRAPRIAVATAAGLALTLIAGACGRTDNNEIGVGGTTTLRITTTQPVSQTVAPPTTPAPQVTYVIQSGDSLSIIAQRFGVSTQQLADFNAIADVHAIKVGQELTIPPVTVATTVTTAPTTLAPTTAAGG